MPDIFIDPDAKDPVLEKDEKKPEKPLSQKPGALSLESEIEPTSQHEQVSEPSLEAESMTDPMPDQDPELDSKQDPKNKTAEDVESENEEDKTSQTPSERDKAILMDSLGIQTHGGRLHALSSYFEDPEKVKFNNKLDEEILLLFLRRHFITNFPWMLKAFALGLIPIIFEFLSMFGFYSTDFVTPEGKIIVYGFYYFFILSGYIFVNYMTWYYNISLVTNIRIVDIDFSNIVFENVAATKLSQVEDVKYSQIGIFRSIFDYGDVFVETAGTASNFQFFAVPHPENVIRIINNLLGKPHD